MVLRIADTWSSPPPAGSWPLEGEPIYAETEAYGALLGDLHRYVNEEITGRSFLISGHRGAGKTSMVLHAVRRLRNAALQQAVLAATESRASPDVNAPQRRRQRPLLVKIVGQSLIAPPPLQTSEEARQQKEAAEAASRSFATTKDANAPEPALAENALVHITIALYRAVAAEVATAAMLHARNSPEPLAQQRAEMAAQLSLLLDAEPDTATLRRFWHTLGRLDQGLLWPPEATDVRRSTGSSTTFPVIDQGYREIVAVSTAAKAFQICAGKLTYSRGENETAGNERTLALSGNFVELVGRVTTLLAGATVGSSAIVSGATSPGVAIGAGVLTWILGSATFSFAGTRSQKRTDTLEQSFIRDRSVQTLDRELPIVIERIRDAGLAPVFVIDELDKVSDANKVIASIIDRLKHVISDHGFFCFLTDRDYYELISRKVSSEAYPTEHTYFSRRLLITHHPTELIVHLKRFLVATEPSDQIPLNTFALVVAYRSKMNFADVGRALDYFITADPIGQPVLKAKIADALRIRRDLRMAATVQIVIEQVVSTSLFEEALRDDPDSAFVQLAIDALYIIPRAWERPDQSNVRISEPAIKEALLARMRGNGVTAKKLEIDVEDLALITRMVRMQATFLQDFASLRDSISARGGDLSQIYLQIAFARGEIATGGLLVKADASDEDLFKFVLDTKGIKLPLPGAPPVNEDKRMAIIRTLAPLVGAFVELLASAQVEYETLVDLNLVPPKLTTALLANAVAGLRAAEQAWTPEASTTSEEETANVLMLALKENAGWLEAGLFAIVRLKLAIELQESKRSRGRAKSSPGSANLIIGLKRYITFPNQSSPGPVSTDLIALRGPGNAYPHEVPAASARGLHDLRTRITDYRAALVASIA